MTHPIEPNNELLEVIWQEAESSSEAMRLLYIAGADAQLEKCIEWISAQPCTWTCGLLRAAMRPKPPSLKEQAFVAMRNCGVNDDDCLMLTADAERIIRRALESLPE